MPTLHRSHQSRQSHRSLQSRQYYPSGQLGLLHQSLHWFHRFRAIRLRQLAQSLRLVRSDRLGRSR